MISLSIILCQYYFHIIPPCYPHLFRTRTSFNPHRTACLVSPQFSYQSSFPPSHRHYQWPHSAGLGNGVYIEWYPALYITRIISHRIESAFRLQHFIHYLSSNFQNKHFHNHKILFFYFPIPLKNIIRQKLLSISNGNGIHHIFLTQVQLDYLQPHHQPLPRKKIH